MAKETASSCGSCGAAVSGKFCASCGAPAAAEERTTRSAAPASQTASSPAGVAATMVQAPATAAGRSTALYWLMGLAGLLIAIVIAIVVVESSGRSTTQDAVSSSSSAAGSSTTSEAPSSETTAPATTAAPTTVRPPKQPATTPPPKITPVLRIIESRVPDSTAARRQVVEAVAGHTNCTLTDSDVLALLQDGATTRSSILATLQGLSVAGVPNGTQLVDALERAMRYSIDADEAYQQWVLNTPQYSYGSGIAYCPPPQNGEYSFDRAQALSESASSAKQEFVAIWNPLAVELGLRVFSEEDL